MSNILQRTCIGCNTKKNKNDLIRIVKYNNIIEIDANGKKPGRGAYICKNIDCLEMAIKKRKLEKNFSCKVNENIYEDLRGVISDKKKDLSC